jgi:hypothetical protein
MADLIACSTVLHNKTISDHVNEITALKQKLKVYEPSKVEYTNRLEYETLKNEIITVQETSSHTLQFLEKKGKNTKLSLAQMACGNLSMTKLIMSS